MEMVSIKISLQNQIYWKTSCLQGTTKSKVILQLETSLLKNREIPVLVTLLEETEEHSDILHTNEI